MMLLWAARKIKHFLAKPQRVTNFQKFLTKPAGKRALVSYLVEPIQQELAGIRTSQFSNNGLGRLIPKVLNSLGYSVDVIDWNDKTFRPNGSYDLAILHGARNYSQLKQYLSAVPIIHYSAGSFWKFHNSQELGRFNYFKARHGVELQPDRFIKASEAELSQAASAIVVLGNVSTKATYIEGGAQNVYNIEAASYPLRPRKKNPMPNHFLFLSGPGNIHKGLDLLLDVFEKHLNLHLHILCSLDKDFESFYKQSLYSRTNIHTYGHIPQRSKQYYDIIDQCAFSVLASCSEGSPGSVIESMHQGLIPLITTESHFDVTNCGLVFASDRLEDIEKVILNASKMSDDARTELSSSSKARIDKDYTLEKFEAKFAKIISEITAREI